LLTIEEIESACAGRTTSEPDPHPVDAPALKLQDKFFPLGFPLEIRTNSEEVLAQCRAQWGYFEQRFDTDPMLAEIYIVESTLQEGSWQQDCPPQPQYRFLEPLLVTIADPHHYSIADISLSRTKIVVTSAALRNPLYFRYFFLEAAAGVHIATRHTTPVHAGCVTLNGRGVLLCGDSGAGKSSLSFACARAGWGYLSDDACFLLHGRRVIGNCHQVRLRPTAADLFPEIAGLPLTPRAEGKPSIELPTGSMPHLRRQHCAEVNSIVFLNRRVRGTSGLFPYSRDVARRYMHQQLFGTRASLARQYAAIERLLEVDVLELRYQTLDEAVEQLRTLTKDR
jgi:predicted ATPase